MRFNGKSWERFGELQTGIIRSRHLREQSGRSNPCPRGDRWIASRSQPSGAHSWMSEAMDLKKEKNFFETGVIEYQNGGALNWE